VPLAGSRVEPRAIVPGFEYSGRVAAVQPGSDLAVGDPVYGVTLFGGYSSRVTVPRNQVPTGAPPAAPLGLYVVSWAATACQWRATAAATTLGSSLNSELWPPHRCRCFDCPRH
jgi:NADPH:quinone reductase-like Zn-dependent oxidoreductase